MFKAIGDFFVKHSNVIVPIASAVGVAVADYFVEKSKSKKNSLFGVIVSAVKSAIQKK